MNSEKWVFNILFLVFLFFGLCNSTSDTITPNQPIKDGELLVSNGKTFALGFFSPGDGTSNRRYVGIWYYKISEQTVVWVANQDNPINGKSGVISINQDGNLVIYDDDNAHNVTWDTNISTAAATNSYYSARLLDSGNLVVSNSSNVVWQSFDYPRHVLLPNMKLGLDRITGVNRFLTSWKSRDDPGKGEYSFKMEDPDGSPQLVLYKGLFRFWETVPWMWNKRTGNFTIFSFIDNRKEVYLSYVQINVSILSIFLVDEFGNIKMNTWLEGKGKWVESYSALDERCDSYGRCGGFGYCNENKGQAEFECTCLPGYEPKLPNEWYYSRDASGGCVKKRATLGMCGNGEGFVKMERAKIPPTSKGVEEMNLSLEECEAKCLRNCSCTAYTIASDGGNYCKTWYGTLMNARTAHSARYSLYIRVDADELLAQHLKKKSKSLHGKKMIIVVTSVVVMAALIISLVCWLVMKKARRVAGFDIHTNDEENLELPIFDMITIVGATNNFSDTNKIGEGGFGPVYKGQLSMGKDIAVKRLSTSSKQGVDEFQNEM